MTYDSFLKAIGGKLDLDWRKYRRRGARRNLDRRLAQLNLSDYGRYLELLDRDREEAEHLPELLRVTVSRFFREQDCWLELAEVVLPELMGYLDEHEPLRAWSVGCCGGEEPYSLALIFLSTFSSRAGNGDQGGMADILATDIDDDVLARARKACYQRSSLREVPDKLLTRFFHQSGGRYCLDDAVCSLVSFKRHNIMEDSPPAGMDLVLCRYLVFTYYLGERRYRAARRLMEALKPGGALMIGRKDALGPREKDLFEPWKGTEVVFRRRAIPG